MFFPSKTSPLSKGLSIMRKRKKYIPNSRFNPAKQAVRIDKLLEDLYKHQKLIRAISFSHDNHITHLANFARHDIKNTIQNMDSILSTTEPGDFTKDKIESLISSLDIIRTTIDNFAKLVPYSTTGSFKLIDLMVSVELLSRADMQKLNIEMVFNYDRQTQTEIDLPFQMVLQMLNNLMINSFKALESTEKKEMLVTATVDEEFVFFTIKDNGAPIPQENSERIFDYGFSTTDGSGIGLYHAKCLCEEFSGHIEVDLNEEADYNKTFSIKLPLKFEENGKDSTNN